VVPLPPLGDLHTTIMGAPFTCLGLKMVRYFNV